MKYELRKINKYDNQYLSSRVNYYNKIIKNFQLEEDAVNINTLFNLQVEKFIHKFFKKEKIKKRTTYFFDLYNYLSYFPSFLKVCFKFGDITENFSKPIIVKSRPIDNSTNSVLMKLNEVRHFYFLKDNINFHEKKNMAIWRGNSNNSKARLDFIKNYYSVSIFDIGQHNPKINKPWYKGYMPIYKQLNYKFIFCIEGADTATNIKWVMSSNSLCVMPKPKYETWFMEGKLIKDFHYIEVENDFSNAEEKIRFYIKNIDKCLKIIENANFFTEQFKDPKLEKLISLLVLKKFFRKSNQIR
tara:strand:+ start:1720 stop:2619 length:900 start_codon:yes stop_codon:yes gene_type:complete